jgi:hypothetical protein
VVFVHALLSGRKGGRAEQTVVGLCGVEHQGFEHQVRSTRVAEVTEAEGWSSDDVGDRWDERAVVVRLVDLLLEPTAAYFCVRPSARGMTTSVRARS